MVEGVYLANGTKLGRRKDSLPFNVIFVYIFMHFVNALKNIFIFLRGGMLVKVFRHSSDNNTLEGIIL